MRLLTIAALLLTVVNSARAAAQDENIRAYTQEHPLVYEDVWDLWPYSFLNEKGEPDGYNVDLLRMVLRELNIPYVIKMKPANDALRDLRDGKSDLMLGLAAGFHDAYGQYSRNAITLFTQSVATPTDKPIEIRTLRDLGRHKVIVNDSSMCYHLMKDYGWEANIVGTNDMRDAIEKLSSTEDGQIVWNTLSLKWLISKYQIDNLQVTPVDMPHGEYKFMSNNPRLLNQLDSIYTILNSAERFTGIQNKWFYPERGSRMIPKWVWVVVTIVALFTLLFFIYFINYRMQARRLARQNVRINQRLALILETSQVRMWTYDIATQLFSWRNENGMVAYTYKVDEFASRYHPGDFKRLYAELMRMADSTQKEEEDEVTLHVKAKDMEDGDAQEHDFQISLSVLRRDKYGKPSVILGTKKDITQEQEVERLEREQELRYWAIFNTPMVGIMYFNKDGILVNINERACETFRCNREEILAERVSFHHLLDMDGIDIRDAEGYHFTQIVDLDKIPMSQRNVLSCKRTGKLMHEVRLMTVYDDEEQPMGMFAVGRDMTGRVKSIEQQRERTKDSQKAIDSLTEYIGNINYVLRSGGVHIANYSPYSHTLTIFNGINEVQHEFTQARCMTLVHEKSKRKAMRLLNSMDNLLSNAIEAEVLTGIRVKGGHLLNLQFNFVPTYDDRGGLKDYFGLCRDITELKTTEQQLAQESAKAQEVENTKNSFLKNMSHEIRTPLNAVVGFAELFEMEHSAEDEEVFVAEILQNSDHLLHLINDILFLSRIDAHMIEFRKQPCDFATIFDGCCQQGWERDKKPGVNYIVENPYQQLVVDIDATNLGHVIEQITANAAQHTNSGTVRARYDYIGRRLMISVEDSGIGISPKDLKRVYERFASGPNNGSGLGLPICKELTEQMGGSLEINSELGLGTTVWITIPCQATAIKRKKYI